MIPNLGVDNVTNLLALRLVEASEGKFSLEEIFRSWGWVTCYPAGPLAPPWPADSSEKWSAEMSSTDVGGHTWSWRPSPRGMIPPSILAPEARRQISVRISDTWHEAIHYNNNVIFKQTQTDCLSLFSNYVTPRLSKLHLQFMRFVKGVASAVLIEGLLISKPKISIYDGLMMWQFLQLSSQRPGWRQFNSEDV